MRKTSYYDVVSNWVTQRKDTAQALRKAKECIEKGAVTLTRHFGGRGSERRFSSLDAINAVKRGKPENIVEEKNGSWRYRVSSNKMVVCYAFGEEDGETVVFITAWWIEGEERRKL